jgi:hypothetical protein
MRASRAAEALTSSRSRLNRGVLLSRSRFSIPVSAEETARQRIRSRSPPHRRMRTSSLSRADRTRETSIAASQLHTSLEHKPRTLRCSSWRRAQQPPQPRAAPAHTLPRERSILRILRREQSAADRSGKAPPRKGAAKSSTIQSKEASLQLSLHTLPSSLWPGVACDVWG